MVGEKHPLPMVPGSYRRRGPLESASVLCVLLAATLPVAASASTHCLPMGYSVTYASPSWTVLVDYAPAAPLNVTWYWSWWNGTFESFVGHAGRPPTSFEPVTLDDVDGNGALSASDRIRIWDDSQSLRNATVAWYGDASRVGYTEGLPLSDGHRYGCSGGPLPLWEDPIVLLGVSVVAVAVVAVIAGIVLSRRSRR